MRQFYPYRSLRVFIAVAGLLVFPVISKTTPFYTLFNGPIYLPSKSVIQTELQKTCQIVITAGSQDLGSGQCLWCTLHLCQLCAKRAGVTCLADS